MLLLQVTLKYCVALLYISIKFLVSMIHSSNVTVIENDGIAVIQIERSGPLNHEILVNISTVNGTALGEKFMIFIGWLMYTSLQLV